ncbi:MULTISPECIES: AzlC family ABC transporter permease [unclassified Pseudomonas]|jgi:4-azaleucine resistance transporter AzlC|uniref:AzlC family ABC transporter permease n=1 Tax=unclassified Pseudomonas TaxID=196821 RepID=UPI0024470A80|nr:MULTISPECIES: AzlC family ABC transporter permease [unclassified Pseudomonas]MDH0894311.1 AzlC family ABC transporter permease [Pseudomonas sp. GD03875]MDH1063394.1 AzlC family ABC transporter permease [Pseudomonas sp. GD03985]
MTRRHEFLQGLRDMLPMLLGAMPFGIIYGSLAGAAGLTPWQTIGMSVLVFAGSAQFIAISLLGGGATLAVLWLTTLVVNLRHALYSATLQPFVRHLPKRWRVPLAFWLTDEAFAVVQHRYAETDASPNKHWYFLGAGLAMYGNWLACTLIGLVFGRAVPNIGAWGLDFAMLATFIGIVVPMLRNRPQVAAALVAAGTALACHGLPYKLGLMAAAGAGIVVGVVLERRYRLLQDEVF